MIRYDALDALPVRSALPGLDDALEGHGTAVLVAPPGTGKTTLVPLALAGLLGESVATRTLTYPSLKSARVRVRAPWVMP
ncbi:hypothetical protein ABZ322_29690, partial [Streptomyces sp. NPDC006129]|uniref:hypothetical protein n=1 Tax=Streptomyces sp. NPDC006129 TaxID=3155348 RepID=UPI0033B34951